MSTWVREGSFNCVGCTPAGCIGHESKIIYQDTADTITYWVDEELTFDGTIEQFTDLKEMLESLE